MFSRWLTGKPEYYIYVPGNFTLFNIHLVSYINDLHACKFICCFWKSIFLAHVAHLMAYHHIHVDAFVACKPR